MIDAAQFLDRWSVEILMLRGFETGLETISKQLR